MWIRQWTNYSCGAAVLQKALKHITGFSIGHRKAIDLTDCEPEGTTFNVVLSVLKNYGVLHRRVYRIQSRITKAIATGEIVLINDMKTYRNDHFSIIMGETATHYSVYDPVWGLAVKRQKQYVLEAATLLYALSRYKQKRKPSRKQRPRAK